MPITYLAKYAILVRDGFFLNSMQESPFSQKQSPKKLGIFRKRENFILGTGQIHSKLLSPPDFQPQSCTSETEKANSRLF